MYKDIMFLILFLLIFSIVVFFYVFYIRYQKDKLISYLIDNKVERKKLFFKKILDHYNSLFLNTNQKNVKNILLFHISFSIFVGIFGYFLNDSFLITNFLKSTLLSVFVFLLGIIILKKIKERKKTLIESSLPELMDLLVLFLKSGLPLQHALLKLIDGVKNIKGYPKEVIALFTEFQRDLFLGISLEQGFKNMTGKVNSPILMRLQLYVLQAEKYGTSIAPILSELSKDLREDKMLQFEEFAQKLPILLSLPLIVCFLPSLLLIIFGPALLKLMSSLHEIFNF